MCVCVRIVRVSVAVRSKLPGLQGHGQPPPSDSSSSDSYEPPSDHPSGSSSSDSPPSVSSDLSVGTAARTYLEDATFAQIAAAVGVEGAPLIRIRREQPRLMKVSPCLVFVVLVLTSRHAEPKQSQAVAFETCSDRTLRSLKYTMSPIIEALARRVKFNGAEAEDVHDIANFIMQSRSNKAARRNAVGDAVMASIICSWRQAVQEGDRRTATQLLSIAVGAKHFKREWASEFDSVVPVCVIRPHSPMHTSHISSSTSLCVCVQNR